MYINYLHEYGVKASYVTLKYRNEEVPCVYKVNFDKKSETYQMEVDISNPESCKFLNSFIKYYFEVKDSQKMFIYFSFEEVCNLVFGVDGYSIYVDEKTNCTILRLDLLFLNEDSKMLKKEYFTYVDGKKVYKPLFTYNEDFKKDIFNFKFNTTVVN